VEKSIESMMDEIRGRLELLESNLPKHVDGWALSQKSKLPFKVLTYRESLAWRMAELSRAAFEELGKDRLVAGATLTRGAVETSAAQWFLYGKVAESVDAGTVGDIDEHLMNLMMGMATDPPLDAEGKPVMPRPVRTGKLLNAVEKDISGFSLQYGYLSEYTHLNWAGTVFLYSKFDKERGTADFGQNARQSNSTKGTCVSNLGVALLMFETSYNRIFDLMPGFIKLCDARANAAAS
jgi:hypothetical protein